MVFKKSKKSDAPAVSTVVKEEDMPSKKSKKTTPVDIQKLVSEAAFPQDQQPAPKTKKAAAGKIPKQPKAAEKKQDLFVTIDYPQEAEIVSGLVYGMRIGASDGGTVEVSVNGGDWSPCRNAGGYWWFDWGYYKPGPHTITARLVDSNGSILKKSAARRCTVA